jgi:hypothetical protein
MSLSIAKRCLAMTLLLGAAIAVSLSAASRADAAPAHTDVMFVFDTTGSMSGALEESGKEIQAAMTQIGASLPDTQFGMATMADYSTVNYNGLPEEFEYSVGSTDQPWTLIAPISPNQSAVVENLQKLEADGGGDSPESYGRALFETDTNPAVGWRPGARGVIVLVADDVPHDNELNEGIPSELWFGNPFNTGVDPGADNTLGTGDDLDWQGTVLQRLAIDGKPLEYVDYHGEEAFFPYWQIWAGRTGGSAVKAEEEGSLIPKLVAAVISGANAALPACPPGQIRDASERCVLPPSNKFELVNRISCSKGCHVVVVKVTFDSAGNVIAESIPEEEGKASSSATASAKAKCGKKSKKAACKKKPLIKKLEQPVVAGTNTLKLKLTGTAIKTLKQKGKLKLKVTYNYTPTGGLPATAAHTYTVKLPKKKKKGGK